MNNLDNIIKKNMTEKQKEGKRKYQKQWRLENKEKIQKYQKQWRLENNEFFNECVNKSKSRNPEKYKEIRKQYRLKNKEKIEKARKQQRLENGKKNYEKIKQRMLEDPLYKLQSNIRRRISQSFKGSGYTKRSRTYEILGCSYVEFKLHIELQFKEGMDWSNHGKWEYDHIIPVSSATNEVEIIKLNHYTNFQPLWRKDNRSKGNKFV